ncbi:MAG: response regulator transcription factor [Ferruginibacter sp.]
MHYKIVLADDHQFLLEGIQNIINTMPALTTVATVNNGIDLMTVVAKENPDLVIMDLNMPGLDGLQCLEKIKSGYPGVKVLVLTNYNQPELVAEVNKMEAEGFLVKNSSAVELKTAIEAILAGGNYFPQEKELNKIPEDSFFFDDFLKKYQLTKREVEIIKMISREKSTKQIAADLFVSELTVNTHRRNIFRKLEISNVVSLVNFARENQLM